MSQIDLIALRAASGAFHTKEFPVNWEDMSDEEQSVFLATDRLDKYEHESNDELYELISDHATEIRRAVVNALGELREKIAQAAIDGTLPDDYSKIDLRGMLGL